LHLLTSFLNSLKQSNKHIGVCQDRTGLKQGDLWADCSYFNLTANLNTEEGTGTASFKSYLQVTTAADKGEQSLAFRIGATQSRD